MIEAILIGLLVNAISGTGRILAGSASSLRRRRGAADLDIARWFDSAAITGNGPALPDLPAEATERLAELLRSDEAQAVVQVLLAARLTDASEAEVARIRAPWDVLFAAEASLPAGLAGTLFDFYDEQIGDLVARLEAADAKPLADIRNDAFATRVVNILGAIERQTAALSGRPGYRTEADFLTRYRRHAIEEHGKLQPPDLDRRRKVPIAAIYVDATVTSDDPLGTVPDPAAQPPSALKVRELAGIIDRSVLLGDPGGGKTTAANVLVHDFASDPSGKVPFLVTLRKYAAEDPPKLSVAEYIEDTLKTFYQIPPPPGLVDLLLLTGRAMVVFDGLDELLDTSRRADVSARVERFCTEYPLVPVLVTSRVVGYDEARLDDSQFRCCRLGGFANEQVADYARKWFALEPGTEPGEAEAFLAESASVPDLRSNPLMLSLMCILYRGRGSLPADRAGVYRQCADLLFRRWDEHRHLHREPRAGRHVEPALRHLAWWLYTRDDPQPAVTEARLVTETTTFLHARGFESEEDARDAAAEFVKFCRERMWVLSAVGTTARGEQLYAFTHRTFLEYFAASRLASVYDTPEDLARALAPRLARDEWQVMAELAVQIKGDAIDLGSDRFYRELLTAVKDPQASGMLSGPFWPPGARGNVLSFLAYDLQSVSISPAVMRDLTRAILDQIFPHGADAPRDSAPIERLLGNSAGYEDLVADEMTARVAALTASSDPVVRRNGLRFAFNLGTRGMGNSLGDVPVIGARAAEYWGRWSAEQVEAHAADILTEAATNNWIRTAALSYGILSVDQALTMPGGLDVLMRYGAGAIGYLMQISFVIFRGLGSADREAERRALEAFAAAGRYLLGEPRPPWVARSSEDSLMITWYLAPSQEFFRPDDVAYLGIAAMVLSAAEVGILNLQPSVETAGTGPLDLLVHYCRRREKIDDATLPDLPVPEGFRQLFRDWADGKVDFAAPLPPEAHHGQ